MPREMTGEDVVKNMVVLSIEGTKRSIKTRRPNETEFTRRIVIDLFGVLEPNDRDEILLLLMHRDEAMRQASPS